MSETGRKPRRNFLINPAFQWTMIRYTLLISLLNSLFFLLATSTFFRNLIDAGIQQNLPPDYPYFELIVREKARMLMIFGLTGFLTLCMITGFGILFSHKIAGPIYSLSRYLKSRDPASGPLPELKFREDDFFQELAKDFNFFLSRIKKP